MSDPGRYQRKPTFILAVEFQPLHPWPLNVRRRLVGDYCVHNFLHNSDITLKPGDMVRVDDPNDTYPIDRATFEATYDPAP